MITSPHTCSRILRLYRNYNWVQLCMPFKCLNDTLLSQGFVLENGFHYGNYGHKVCSKDRKRVRRLWLLGSSSKSTGNHELSITSPNIHNNYHKWLQCKRVKIIFWKAMIRKTMFYQYIFILFFTFYLYLSHQ